jgi:hypothetical protein
MTVFYEKLIETGAFKDFTLAEHVRVSPTRLDPSCKHIDIYFDWLCPYCGARHWAEELAILREYGIKFWQLRLPCGFARVRFSWTYTKEADKQSVYGQAEEVARLG